MAKKEKEKKRKRPTNISEGVMPLRPDRPVQPVSGFPDAGMSFMDPHAQEFMARFFNQTNPFAVQPSFDVRPALRTPAPEPTVDASDPSMPGSVLGAIAPGLERVRSSVVGAADPLRERAQNLREQLSPGEVGMDLASSDTLLGRAQETAQDAVSRAQNAIARNVNPDLADPTHARETAREIFEEGSLRTLLGRMLVSRFAPALAQQLTNVGLEGLESPQGRAAAADNLALAQSGQRMAGTSQELAGRDLGLFRQRAGLGATADVLSGVPGANMTAAQLGTFGAAAPNQALRRAGAATQAVGGGTGREAFAEAETNLAERTQAMKEFLSDRNLDLKAKDFNLRKASEAFRQDMSIQDLFNRREQLDIARARGQLSAEELKLSTALNLTELQARREMFEQDQDFDRAMATRDMIFNQFMPPEQAIQTMGTLLGNFDKLPEEAQTAVAESQSLLYALRSGLLQARGGAGDPTMESLFDMLNKSTQIQSRLSDMIDSGAIPTEMTETMKAIVSSLNTANTRYSQAAAILSEVYGTGSGPGVTQEETEGRRSVFRGLQGEEFTPLGSSGMVPLMRFMRDPAGSLLRLNESAGRGIMRGIQGVTSAAPLNVFAEAASFGDRDVQLGERTTDILEGRVQPQGALGMEAFERLLEERLRGR